MRVLVLTSHFPPDISAGAFRMSALVSALTVALPGRVEVHVVTTAPNRFNTDGQGIGVEEGGPGYLVTRVQVPSHGGGAFGQARMFVAFALGALAATRGRDYDVVVATTAKQMTGVLGRLVASRLRSPLYLDVRDIFAESFDQLVGPPLSWIARPLVWAMERYAVSGTSLLNVVSAGFVPYFSARYPGRDVTVHTNGIDPIFSSHAWRMSDNAVGRVRRILYAGNIGDGQGLHLILPALAGRLGREFSVRVVGDGARLGQLKREVESRGVDNVEFVAPMPRSELLREYEAADILFLHLNVQDAFTRVLPSKIFEYAVTGRPIVAGVAGTAAKFLRDSVPGSHVFAPGDVDAAVELLRHVEVGLVPRARFVSEYDRDAIMQRMVDDIVSLTRPAETL